MIKGTQRRNDTSDQCHGNDDREVSEGKSVDDDRGGASLGRLGDVASGRVRVARVMLGNEGCDGAGPHSKQYTPIEFDGTECLRGRRHRFP